MYEFLAMAMTLYIYQTMRQQIGILAMRLTSHIITFE